MALPPRLSDEERNRALEIAKASRQERAQFKNKLNKGEITLAQLLDSAERSPALAKMRVLELLESIPGYGKIRAQSLMEKYEISSTRRIQGLGRHQRQSLLKEFDIPNNHQRGRLLVLSGPGGVGKSSVAKALRLVDGFWVSVSATTRAARFNESEGVDYFFYSNERFD